MGWKFFLAKICFGKVFVRGDIKNSYLVPPKEVRRFVKLLYISTVEILFNIYIELRFKEIGENF